MPLYLHAIQLKNYRGVGDVTQRIGPFKKCNFFIGSNNSGKSCVLSLIANHLDIIGSLGRNRLPDLMLSQLDIHLGKDISQVMVGIGYPIDIFHKNSLILLKATLNNHFPQQ